MSKEKDNKEKDKTEGGGAEEKKEDGMEVDADKTKVVGSADVEIGNPGSMTIELCRIVAKDDLYYSKHPNSNNPYHVGYFTKPLHKLRLSYLLYQGIFRLYIGKKYPKKPLLGATDAVRDHGEQGGGRVREGEGAAREGAATYKDVAANPPSPSSRWT